MDFLDTVFLVSVGLLELIVLYWCEWKYHVVNNDLFLED